MQEFQQKRKFRKQLYSKKSIVALIFMLAIVGNATYKVYKKDQSSKASLAQASKEFGKLNLRKSAIDLQIERLKTDQGIEEVIRQKFQVVKPGEQIAVILNDTTTTPAQEEEVRPSLWQKFLGMFR